ncbi:MAG: aspartate ammonia-lyase, partial [Pusillimonas sp.]
MTLFRTEHDLLGAREVPDEVYYGVHTLRAKENFQLSGITIESYPDLIFSLAAVKQASTEANT